ncbi:hypothetical protein QTP88_006018 [Uroleucon formosanum]
MHRVFIVSMASHFVSRRGIRYKNTNVLMFPTITAVVDNTPRIHPTTKLWGTLQYYQRSPAESEVLNEIRYKSYIMPDIVSL